MQRWWWLGWMIGVVACQQKIEDGPDIIILSVDTLRADHVGALNPTSPSKTPNIDRIAERGIRYTQAWSPISVTGPAFCTLHTGRLPGSHGVAMNIFRGGNALSFWNTTLAERLRRGGYHTAAFVSGFTLRPQLGLYQGFDIYDAPENNYNRKGQKTNDAALAWLTLQEPGEPIMMWYHTFDAHGPLHRWRKVPLRSRRWKRDPEAIEQIARYQRINEISSPEFYERRYAAAVEFADKQIGRLLDALDEAGRLDDAIVVFVADHGESFTERGLWFDHGTTPFAEQLRVPLLIKLPGDARAGETVETMVGLEDVTPSLLNQIGARAISGVDGVDTILSRPPAGRILTGESSHCKKQQREACDPNGPRGKMFSARDDTIALIRRPTAQGVRYEVYDRSVDPGERKPTGDAPPEEMKRLVDEMAESRLRMNLPEPAGAHEGEGEQEEDDETRALRELGYIE
ncbi:MAG: sulfatase [Myxococcota bacterium]